MTGERVVASSSPAARSATPRFVVLEGLSGVGKSTIAPLLATVMEADFLNTMNAEFAQARHWTDTSSSVEARLHLWLAVNYSVSERVRERMATGRSVVIESYFFRSLATHAAMGARSLPRINWDRAVIPDAAVLLTADEPVRLQRLRSRRRRGNRWSLLEEHNIAEVRRMYTSFGLTRFDTTDKHPAHIAVELAGLVHSVVDRERPRTWACVHAR